jgi:LPS-assembly protein
MPATGFRVREVLRYLICCLTAFLIFGQAGPNAAQLRGIKPEDVVTKFPDIPWQLKADEVSYDHKTNVYIARGHVELSKTDKKLTADYIRFDRNSMRAYAYGNVVLISGEDIVKGSAINIDLDGQVGSIQEGYIFLKENNFHIVSEAIRKTGEATYEAEKATITSCDGDKPDWKISAEEIEVAVEGYGTAEHATVYVKDVPVFYTPYFYYPAKRKRQTGFLFPEFGYSDRRGVNYNQPFFWAISDSQDATFYAHYLDKRGVKPGAEYRYILSETTKGAVMFDGMHDRKVDSDLEGKETPWFGFEDPDVQLPRTNEERWWFRMSHYQKAPWDFNAKLDVDLVSDQDYLREFRTGYMGFQDARKYFNEKFGRELDDFNDPIRLNRFNLNRIWPSWSVNAEARYFWDSTQENSDLPDTTISRLPVIDFQGSKQQLFTTPLFFDLNSNYNYFWRPTGSRGQRLDLFPRLYWPFRLGHYFTFEPSAGVRETLYYLDDIDDNEGFDRTDHREIFDLRLVFFSEVYKVFNFSGENIKKIKHSIRPEVSYEFIPEVSQGDLPEFDDIDRIDDESLLTYSLTQTLTSKKLKAVKTRLADRNEVSRGKIIQDPDSYNYDDFLRFRLEQSVDLRKSNRKFSPIAAKLDFFPGQYISIDADTEWSVYGDGFVSHNIGAAVWDNRGDRFYVDYRFNKFITQEDIDTQNIESIYLKANLAVTSGLSLFGDYERNINESLHVRTSAGLKYVSQCWSVYFQFTDEPDDTKYEFKIDLHGLGGIGF